jgi:hypothetical protein
MRPVRLPGLGIEAVQESTEVRNVDKAVYN